MLRLISFMCFYVLHNVWCSASNKTVQCCVCTSKINLYTFMCQINLALKMVRGGAIVSLRVSLFPAGGVCYWYPKFWFIIKAWSRSFCIWCHIFKGTFLFGEEMITFHLLLQEKKKKIGVRSSFDWPFSLPHSLSLSY